MPLLQLLIALTIAATLALMSLSHYQNWRTQKTLSLSLEQISQQIELAHTLNITRGEPIYFCASLDAQECDPAWQGALIVFSSNAPPRIDQIFSRKVLADTVHIQTATHFQKDLAFGFMNGGEMVYNGKITIESNQQRRCLNISKTGVTKEISCQNQAAAG